MTSPDVVRELLFTKLADLGHQVFVALLIDSQHRLIEYVRTLSRHAGANQRLSPRGRQDRTCAQRRGDDLAHNHPSGIAEPSRADEILVQALKQALAVVDVRVLLDAAGATSTLGRAPTA